MTACQEEIVQLAHLLRVGAALAREIAYVRPRDAVDILDLAKEAENIACRLDEIADKDKKLN